MPGTDGGSVGTSNTGRPSRSCSSVQTACGSREPEHRRERDPLARRRGGERSCADDVGAERRVVERAREAERVDVGAAARARGRARRRAPRYPSAPQVVGQQRRVEVLQRAEARRRSTAPPPRRSPPAIVSGHERRRLQRADRGRQQHVLARGRPYVGARPSARLEPRERRRDRLGARRSAYGWSSAAGRASASRGRSTRSGA